MSRTLSLLVLVSTAFVGLASAWYVSANNAASAAPLRDATGASVAGLDPALLAEAGRLIALERELPAPPQRLGTRAREDSAPALPCAAATRPLRAVVRTTEEREGLSVTRDQVFTRSAERLFLGAADGSVGWWLRRNPIAPAQYDGLLIDPVERNLAAHTHSDLVGEGIAASWEEAAGLGFDLARIAKLETSAERMVAFGHEFVTLTSPGALRAVLWSADLHLPLRTVHEQDGRRVVQEIVELVLTPDDALLADPRLGHPGWTAIDLADLRDCSHATGKGDGHDHAAHAAGRHDESAGR